MTGGGKYDKAATAARQIAKAHGVVLMVIDGEHGNGFEVQCNEELTPMIIGALPKMLRLTAHQIETGGKMP